MQIRRQISSDLWVSFASAGLFSTFCVRYLTIWRREIYKLSFMVLLNTICKMQIRRQISSDSWVSFASAGLFATFRVRYLTIWRREIYKLSFTLRPTQSIVYIPFQVNRFHTSILLIGQYKYLKSCSEDLILKNLILRTRSCRIAFITQHFRRHIFYFSPKVQVSPGIGP